MPKQFLNNPCSALVLGLVILSVLVVSSLRTVPANAMDMSSDMSMDMNMTGDELSEDMTSDTLYKNQAPQRYDAALPPQQGGQWSVVGTLPTGFNSVHVATAPSGRSLILIAGSGNNKQDFNAGTFQSYKYDLVGGAFTKLKTPSDLFCSGHSYVGNQLLVMGGTAAYGVVGGHDFYGSSKAYLLNPETGVYTPVQNMRDGRWYPAAVRMGDGSVITTSGKDAQGVISKTSERYQPASQTWDLLPGNPNWGNLYPNIFLADNGLLFYSGAHTFGNGNKQPAFWNPTTNAFIPVAGSNSMDSQHRDESAAFFAGAANNGRMVVAGGGSLRDKSSVNTSAYIDINSVSPTWKVGPSLAHAKLYVLPVNLPNEQTLITGGASTYKVANASVLEAQLMNASGTALTTVNAPTVPRNYHSAAVLAYDGSVYVTGGNPKGTPFERRIERYQPAYMFAASPPSINSLSANTATYGDTVTINTTSTYGVNTVEFIAPMATTHSYDSNQRIVRGTIISKTATSVTVQLTNDHNLMPPGPWMTFVTDSRGVPNRNAQSIIVQ